MSPALAGIRLKNPDEGHLGGSVGEESAFGCSHNPRVPGSSPYPAPCSAGALLLRLPLPWLMLALCQINK